MNNLYGVPKSHVADPVRVVVPRPRLLPLEAPGE